MQWPFFVLVAVSLIGAASAETWYMAWNASSTSGCGKTLARACASLSQLLPQVAANDVVLILSSFNATNEQASSSPPNCSALLPDLDALAPRRQRYACESVVIGVPLVLRGLGGLAVFDCGGQGRALHFAVTGDDGAATVDRLLVVNGTSKTQSGGGAVLIEASGSGRRVAALLTNSCFVRNRATVGSGGAVTIVNGYAPSPIVSQCYFDGNAAAGSGGGLALLYQSATLQSEDVALSDCRFTGNTANVSGGGVYVALATLPGGSAVIDNVVVLLTASVFAGNAVVSTASASEMTIGGGGAALAFLNDTSNVQIRLQNVNCTANAVRGSGSSGAAGAAVDVHLAGAFDYSMVTLTKLVAVDNSCSTTGNGPAKGGAVAVRVDGTSVSSSVSLSSSGFEANAVRGLNDGAATGGALAVAYRSSASYPRLVVAGSAFTRNVAESGLGNAVGGALAAWFGMSATGSSLVVANVQFFLNQASAGASNGNSVGGALAVYYNNYGVSGYHRVDACVFNANYGYSPNNGNGLGGGLAVFFNNEAFNNTVTLSRSTFERNALAGAQQGVEVGGAAAVVYNDQSRQNQHYFDHCTFSQNSITVSQNGVSTGGGLALYNNNGQSVDSVEQFSANVFDQNTAMTCPQYVLSPLKLCK